jgi:hypothetical protein
MHKTSEDVDKITAALVTVKKDVSLIEKNKSGHFGLYVDLENLMATLNPKLVANGLVVSQSFDKDISNNILTVYTRSIHVSGQWLETCLPLPITRRDEKGSGSSISYARRYAILSHFCLAQTDNLDDYADEVSVQEDFMQELYAAMDKLKLTTDQRDDYCVNVCKALKIESMAEIPQEHYRTCLNYLEKQYADS